MGSPKPNTRRLAAIMFTDIVGYTAMMQRNEQEGLAKARRFRAVMEEQVAGHQGEILQFMGDGCLCIFHSAVEAMHAAKGIQLALKREPQVPLRIGIHIGDIVIQEGNIYGDGVNIASRVESMGVPGSVLVTEQVIPSLKSHPEFEMTSLGKFHFKNVEQPMEVFALASAGFVVPQKKELGGKLQAKPSSRMPALLIAALLLGLLGVGMWNFFSQSHPNHTGITENSVAVLPFLNMNKDEEGDMFCDGMMEDILTYLSKIEQLKVISRTSAMHYKGSSKKIQEIAAELGVSHIVEGSVRTYGNKARINVKVIHVSDDQQLWAENYDRNLEDIFEVQSDVAQQIVQALQVNISPRERTYLKTTHRTSPKVYRTYIRGKRVADEGTREGLEQSIRLYESAIQLDSSFADVYSFLAYSKFMLAVKHYGQEEVELEMAEQLANKCLSLDPQNVMAYNTLGAIYHVRGDLRKKKEMVEKTLQLAPNHPIVNNSAAFYFEEIGDYEQALSLRKKALELDPLVVDHHVYYLAALIKNGQLEEAKKQMATFEQLFPTFMYRLDFSKGIIALREKNYQAAISLLAQRESKTWMNASLGFCYARVGKVELATAEIQKVQLGTEMERARNVAIIYAGLQKADSVERYLGLAVDQFLKHDLTPEEARFFRTSIETSLYFEELRENKGFGLLLKKLE